MTHEDPRYATPRWNAREPGPTGWRLRLTIAGLLVLAAWYFGWLLQPGHVGSPLLFGLLVAAEMFNLVQALGFWWTCLRQRSRPALRLLSRDIDVDVLIPVYDEPVEIVGPTVAAAVRMRGARVHVALLDDGASPEMRALAARHGARYIARDERTGAKAGNVNHALALTDSPAVLVLDCDHVPHPRMLEATLGHLADEQMAFVQTPQYYANAPRGGVAAAAWAQQALFFGAIARGKDGHGAMFCCGTNVLFRRAALEDAGGFPTNSLTEDFELSIVLHERGWKTAYLPEVLARGLGPEDMASYVSQQQRWARGCLSALPRIVRAKLPLRLKAQYLLSCMFFLSGWTVLLYMSLPVIRILTGAQPLAGATADQFLLHFAPYFCGSLLAVASLGAGAYTFAAFALQGASAWIHAQASVLTALGRRGRFVVTPKQGDVRRQPRAVAPALVATAVLLGAAAYGLSRDASPATLNNVAFAALHVCVLLTGAWPALRKDGGAAVTPAEEEEAPPATAKEAA
jgi:cellulose synthase (UDP-forming)